MNVGVAGVALHIVFVWIRLRDSRVIISKSFRTLRVSAHFAGGRFAHFFFLHFFFAVPVCLEGFAIICYYLGLLSGGGAGNADES